jgi:hypothetical protein
MSSENNITVHIDFVIDQWDLFRANFGMAKPRVLVGIGQRTLLMVPRQRAAPQIHRFLSE